MLISTTDDLSKGPSSDCWLTLDANMSVMVDCIDTQLDRVILYFHKLYLVFFRGFDKKIPIFIYLEVGVLHLMPVWCQNSMPIIYVYILLSYVCITNNTIYDILYWLAVNLIRLQQEF